MPPRRPRRDRGHDVVDPLDAPRAGPRGARARSRCGVPDHVARLLAATPSLRVSWLLAVVAGARVRGARGQRARPVRRAELALFLFLVVAALLPVAGVAAAFGPGVDPAHEIGLAAPMRADRAAADARDGRARRPRSSIAAVAALALPGLDWIAAAWLLPAARPHPRDARARRPGPSRSSRRVGVALGVGRVVSRRRGRREPGPPRRVPPRRPGRLPRR